MQGEMSIEARLLRDTLGLPKDVTIVGASFQASPGNGDDNVVLLLKGDVPASRLRGYAFVHECNGLRWLRTELYPK